MTQFELRSVLKKTENDAVAVLRAVAAGFDVGAGRSQSSDFS